ncbi:ABC transporter ATP-binding protein [Parasporobacterium paucivorans]|uniref:ABC-2 type transport system ATP-binding protein n=1 Tax=Parasporobacterium paucivorans DSM 15970 TaxID=1122934 RepID=A0A1M6H6L1_9FIRM|nr:ABC transporter ATP-binding protein [Parasporobacterium paucivorans]SHJ17858.1 ABC-2 type transport system ATP-binding protein [Parasporobacterium paucivorans DSM 15970]
MIEIDGISKTYGGTVKAVDHMTFEVKDGEITAVIGPNGAGKTTVLKMIVGILAPDEGNIRINGHDIVSDPLEAKMQFGFVADNPDVFLRLKGIEYLNFMGDLYGVSTEERQKQIEIMGDRFEMKEALNDKILSYSHGMRQKIVVMGALLHSPSVWILDEPLTGLDPRSAFELKEMMKEHTREGKSVVFSTHVLEVAEKLCDKVAIINKGRLVFMGTLNRLREENPGEDSLENIFLKMTEGL